MSGISLRIAAALTISVMLAAPGATEEAAPAVGLRLSPEVTDQLRGTAEANSRPEGFRADEIRPNGDGTATGVTYHTEDVYTGRFKRSTSPFHAEASHWVFDEGVYVKGNGDRYLGRFHFFHENWNDYNYNQEDWVTPYTGAYILVGSHIPAGGAPRPGIFGAEIHGDSPIAFAPADPSYLAQFEQRYRSQVAAFKRAQAEEESGGLSFGQVLALGLGAAALSVADIPSTDAIAIGGALATDVLSGGETNTLGDIVAVQQQGQQVGATTTGGATATSAGAAADAGYTTEQVTISCPSGASNTIPISYKTRQCRSAMIAYAQVYACNRIDDFARAAQTCSSACGNAQCRE